MSRWIVLWLAICISGRGIHDRQGAIVIFASAVFLAGLALLTVPWWLHRLNAHAAEQHTFSSLFLMRPSDAPVNMRKQLQHLVLLILRWLLLIAACLAFAEPILELTGSPVADEEPEPHRLLVVDTSLSMNAEVDGGRVIERARNTARQLIGELPDGGKAALITTADQLTLAVPLTDDQSRLTGAAATMEAGAARSRFDGLMARLTTLGGTLAGPGERLEVHLISDFQATALPDQFNALIHGSVWPVVLHPVVDGDELTSNRAITGLRRSPRTEGKTVEVTVRALNAPGETVEIELARNGSAVGRESLFVPENGTATATFALPGSDPVSDRRRGAVTWLARLITRDALAADNVRRLVEADTETAILPVLTTSERAHAYLRAAIRAAAPRFLPERITDLSDTQVPVVAVLDPGTLTGGTDRILLRYLNAGGAVLMTAGARTRSAGSLPLIDLPLAADRFEQSARGVVASDMSHPVLAGFDNWRDLTFFQAVQPVPGNAASAAGQVILSLDDGTPVLTEYQLGTGTLMVLGTALDPAWNTLVVQPAFVGLMANLVGYLAEDLLPAEALVGQPFAIPAQSVQLFDDNGERVLGLADTVGRPTVRLTEPGVYQLRTPSSSRRLAVNTDLAESDLTRAPDELLARWQTSAQGGRSVTGGEPGITATPANGSDAAAARHSWAVSLAPWLLVLLALLVFIESLTANLFPGRAREPGRKAVEASA
jgi:hypothetical protein